MKNSHVLITLVKKLFVFLVFVLTAGLFTKPVFAACMGIVAGNLSYTGQTCTIASSTIEGVYAGTGNNTAVLTLTSDSITINGTLAHGSISIGSGVTISMLAGGVIKKDNICGKDQDADGYPLNLTWTVGCAANYRALAALTSISQTDCNDTNVNVHSNITCYTDADGDTYTVGSGASQCATSCSGGTTATQKQYSGNDDCNDADAAHYYRDIYSVCNLP